MIVAELKIIPVGQGSSMDEPVQRAIDALADAGVRYEVGALSTTFEANSMDTILEAVRLVHGRLVEGVPRVLLQITIDHRIDKAETVESLRQTAR